VTLATTVPPIVVALHGRNVGFTDIGAAAKNPWVSDIRTGRIGKGL
jgi:hypothetical protein